MKQEDKLVDRLAKKFGVSAVLSPSNNNDCSSLGGGGRTTTPSSQKKEDLYNSLTKFLAMAGNWLLQWIASSSSAMASNKIKQYANAYMKLQILQLTSKNKAMEQCLQQDDEEMSMVTKEKAITPVNVVVTSSSPKDNTAQHNDDEGDCNNNAIYL
ncbi:hypothetical protein ACA910_021568 [Epithemia clementina (nom. ined.)]